MRPHPTGDISFSITALARELTVLSSNFRRKLMPTKPEHLWYDVKYFDHLKSKRWYTYKAQLENIATAEEERAALFRRSPHFKSVIVRCEVITTATPLTLEPAERVAAFLSSK